MTPYRQSAWELVCEVGANQDSSSFPEELFAEHTRGENTEDGGYDLTWFIKTLWNLFQLQMSVNRPGQQWNLLDKCTFSHSIHWWFWASSDILQEILCILGGGKLKMFGRKVQEKKTLKKL